MKRKNKKRMGISMNLIVDTPDKSIRFKELSMFADIIVRLAEGLGWNCKGNWELVDMNEVNGYKGNYAVMDEAVQYDEKELDRIINKLK